MRNIISLILVAVLAVSAASCNGTESAPPASDAAKSNAAAAPKDTTVAIADFTLNDLDGNAVNTADVRKGKVLVLKFGATWCPPCTAQIPHLNKIAATYAGKVAVIEVDIEEPAAKVKAHAERHKITYPVLLDEDGKIGAAYRVSGIPSVIVADKDGKIVYRGNYSPVELLKAQIDPLLK